MTLMLAAMFGAVLVGTFARSFGRREIALVVGLAIALTVVYFMRPHYMT
jgi:hypothetical protein